MKLGGAGRLVAGLIIVAAVLAAHMPTGARAMLTPSGAAAQPDARTRVAILAPDDDRLAGLIAAEFEFLGFTPEPVDGSVLRDPADLDALARERGVAAAVLVRGSGSQVQVWIADRITGKVVIRDVVGKPGGDPRAVAVKAVELLRASLLELEHEPTARPERAPAPVQRVLRPPPPRFGITLTGAAAGAGGGLGPVAALRASFRVTPHPHLGWVLRATAPLSAARIAADEGEAEVRLAWLTTGLQIAFREPHRVVRPDLTLAVGGIALALRGHATPPYTGGRDLILTGLAELTAGVRFRVTPWLRARLAGSVGACFTRPEVHFAGHRVASWCLPYGVGEAGLGVVW